MGKALDAEVVLASIIELRASMAEQGKRSEKETAELRASIAEQGKRSEKETAELRASIAEQGAELRASIAELRKNMEQSNAELRASIAESRKNMEQSNAELRKNMELTNSKLDHNTHVMGLLTNKLGGIIESIVIPGIVEKFNEKGFGFDSVSTNVEFLNEKKTGNVAEVDALLENGSFVIAVEAKTDMQVSDVNEHIKRLKALRKIPRFKGKKIYGAFSTAIARKRPVNYALEQGFYVLQQPDVMGVKILDFPKGRSAKAW
jgi:chromosome segregation ATPase